MSVSGYTDQQRRTAAAAALGRRSAGERKWLGNVAAEWNVAIRTLRNWIDEFYPEATAEPEPQTQRTPYPLRGIAWCGDCRQPMLAGHSGTDHAYLCRTGCNRRTAVLAAVLHDRVLTAVTGSAATVLRHATNGEPGIYLVPGLILRVTVDATADHLRLLWRPGGYDPHAAVRHAAPRRPMETPKARTAVALL